MSWLKFQSENFFLFEISTLNLLFDFFSTLCLHKEGKKQKNAKRQKAECQIRRKHFSIWSLNFPSCLDFHESTIFGKMWENLYFLWGNSIYIPAQTIRNKLKCYVWSEAKKKFQVHGWPFFSELINKSFCQPEPFFTGRISHYSTAICISIFKRIRLGI